MKSLSRFANPLQKLHLLRSLSSSPAIDGSVTLAADRRRRDAVEDSPVYLRSMLRRPPVVNRWNVLRNSCSFIGTVVHPVRNHAGEKPRPGSYTVLEVPSPSISCDLQSGSGFSSFRILLTMSGKLSEISLRHLKPNDYIYVRGPLCSYGKVNASGKHETSYKVLVMDLNFVRSKKSVTCGADELALPIAGAFGQERVSSGVLDDEECRDRLRLWQVFFANPYEWWDNRRGKKSQWSPDFKHKDTKECLRIRADDPPWVKKQLQLYDSTNTGGNRSQPNAFEWKLDDFG